jgi:LuxR family quorum sensing-dependent transcriptional regulator
VAFGITGCVTNPSFTVGSNALGTILIEHFDGDTDKSIAFIGEDNDAARGGIALLTASAEDKGYEVVYGEAVLPAPPEVMGDAREFKLRDGLAFPLVTLEGQIVMVSLGGEAVQLSGAEFGLVSLVSTYAVGRAMQLHTMAANTIDHIELTPRERECLKWAAVGKSEWEISQILGISEHTSEKHLLNAKGKLGAVNRVQAVAEAIRRGYIS